MLEAVSGHGGRWRLDLWLLEGPQPGIVGRHPDAQDKIAEVKKTCDAQLSMLLIDATSDTYIEMQKVMPSNLGRLVSPALKGCAHKLTFSPMKIERRLCFDRSKQSGTSSADDRDATAKG